MNLYSNKEKCGCHHIVDLWGAYRGKYPDPTPAELNLIELYLRKFEVEDDAFFERKDFKALKNRLQCPNLRDLLIKFLDQVRGSKGYDVDMYFDFLPYTKFVPRRLDDKKYYDEAMSATIFALTQINARMLSSGKNYELVSVDKSVLASLEATRGPHANKTINTLLLTFTADEIIAADAIVTVVLLQAMVRLCDQPSSTFQLKEWKYKPF